MSKQIKITNNKPNRNRKAGATFFLWFIGENEPALFERLVRVYAKIEGAEYPGVNNPVTYGKYTFEIIEGEG